MRLLPLLALLCACTPEVPDETFNGLAEADAAAEPTPIIPPDAGTPPPPPPPPPPAPPALPGLLPLTNTQVVEAAGTPARCILRDNGAALLVVVPGRALVNDRGRIVLLEAEAKSWGALLQGGSFSGEAWWRVSMPAPR